MEELDLKELLDLFLSKIFQIILIVVIAMGAGVIYSFGFVVPKYSSKTSLVLTVGTENSTEAVNSNAISTTDVTLNSKLVPTYRGIVTSDKLLRQVISNLNIDVSEETLKRNISVETQDDAEIIEIVVTNENAANAAKIANEIAKVFSDRIKEIYKIDNIYILDEAEVDSVPCNINHAKDIIIFAFIGLVIAVGYVLVANMLDTTIKSPEDIEKGFNLPVLVSVPLIETFNLEKGGKKK